MWYNYHARTLFFDRRSAMSEKRRDNRNRILHEGEYQRADGRYRFRYIDIHGNEKNIYSWRLDHNDPIPKGKKMELSLREKEKQVEQDLFNQVVSGGGGLTVLELVEKYVSLKVGVRQSTYAGYRTVINLLKKDDLGKRRIDKVKLSDAKAWLIKLQMAQDDDLIRKNPFEFQLVNVVVNDSVRRDAVTRKQERDFLKFIEDDSYYCRYYDAIYILFNTGLRISEFCGLTKADLDFKNKRIRVDHQLQRSSHMQYIIEKPKTESGLRYVPMSDEVAACFKRILKKRANPKVEPMVDGMSGFLFLDKNDMPRVALHWEKYFQHIRDKYNRIYKIQIPCIAPHVCRHTFCTNMAKSGMNPKMLQYIMGHSDISVTLNHYTHVKYQDAQEDFDKVMNA